MAKMKGRKLTQSAQERKATESSLFTSGQTFVVGQEGRRGGLRRRGEQSKLLCPKKKCFTKIHATTQRIELRERRARRESSVRYGNQLFLSVVLRARPATCDS